ncbi:MAG: nucleotidyltransferase family protein [Planctomycetes bacterium]|nr:nucleotidyltransferase family protein [Planctomycetota bacterium]
MHQAHVIIDPALMANFCHKHGVARLLAYGSVLRNDFDPTRSDVDLLVEFLPGVHRGLFKFVAMRQELTRMVGREIDLTTPNSLSKYFRQDVLDSAEVLYDAA